MTCERKLSHFMCKVKDQENIGEGADRLGAAASSPFPPPPLLLPSLSSLFGFLILGVAVAC